jgi:SprT-like domain-contaning protein Spartan
MIHAYLIVTKGPIHIRHGHGEDFYRHAERINRLAGTHISQFHTWHEEAAYYMDKDSAAARKGEEG